MILLVLGGCGGCGEPALGCRGGYRLKAVSPTSIFIGSFCVLAWGRSFLAIWIGGWELAGRNCGCFGCRGRNGPELWGTSRGRIFMRGWGCISWGGLCWLGEGIGTLGEPIVDVWVMGQIPHVILVQLFSSDRWVELSPHFFFIKE